MLKDQGAAAASRLIMQAYGGVLGIEATCKNAVGIIESGPAAGIVGTRFLGEHIGEKNILATDMGGTTFKVSVVRDGVIERDYKPVILRYNILVDQDLGRIHRRRRRQYRLDRSGNRPAQSRTSGSRRSAGAGLLRYRWQRADGLRRRSGARLSKRELFSRRPNEAQQSQDAGRHEGKNRQAAQDDRSGSRERHLSHRQFAYERSDS